MLTLSNFGCSISSVIHLLLLLMRKPCLSLSSILSPLYTQQVPKANPLGTIQAGDTQRFYFDTRGGELMFGLGTIEIFIWVIIWLYIWVLIWIFIWAIIQVVIWVIVQLVTMVIIWLTSQAITWVTVWLIVWITIWVIIRLTIWVTILYHHLNWRNKLTSDSTLAL